MNPLLGIGRGIDHLVIAVRDLETSRGQFRDVLGFTMSAVGKHPGGTENCVAGFRNKGYLELLGVYDPNKEEDLTKFLERNEGAVALGLAVSSAENTASFLRSKGFEVDGPMEGTITFDGVGEAPPAFWRWVGIKNAEPAVRNVIFFIEYDDTARAAFRKKYPDAVEPSPRESASTANHPNTALRIASVWVAVEDLEKATQSYTSIGLRSVCELPFPQLNAIGREIEAGTGNIVLLQPEGLRGVTAEFLKQREAAGIVGVSLEITDLETTRNLLEKRTSLRLSPYAGNKQHSLLVPPEFASGIWIEMFEKS